MGGVQAGPRRARSLVLGTGRYRDSALFENLAGRSMSNALDVSKDLGGSTKSNAFEDFVAAIRGMTVQVLCVDM